MPEEQLADAGSGGAARKRRGGPGGGPSIGPGDPAAPSTSGERALLGREAELDRLEALLAERGPALITVTGPRGRGKTALVARALASKDALHFQGAPLTEGDLLRDLEELARATLGEAPVPRRPGVLPTGPGRAGWFAFFMGLRDRVEDAGRPFILALDGMETLLSAHRRLTAELTELFQAVRAQGVPLRLLLTARSEGTLAPLVGDRGTLGPADLEIRLGALPFGVAGWGHGGRDPRDAFLRWALLGDDPARIEPEARSDSIATLVIGRVLEPGGDLHDGPLHRLEATFQRPARYASVLRALASGPRDWAGILERASGVESGSQLAPYLAKLEEEGLVRVDLPLDAVPGSRTRRYSLADPFFGFWFGWVLPNRSLLASRGARAVWSERIWPTLGTHFQRALEQAARAWLAAEAEPAFGAPAREVGALWGSEADFPVAGRLSNGQVCYGLVDWEMRIEDLPREMNRRMADTRYGIGRQARAALFFVGGEESEELRRTVAREPLARVVDLARLMGSG
jgi:hypothetical protein